MKDAGNPGSSSLNEKQKLFCREYLKDFNATQAYIRAGYSPNGAKQAAFKLLTNADLCRQLTDTISNRTQKAEIDGQRVILELSRLLTVDIIDAFHEDNYLKPLKEIPEDVRRAISAIEIDEIWEKEGSKKVQVGITHKVKFWNKTEAANLLGKHFKLWMDNYNNIVIPLGDLSLEEIIKLAQSDTKPKEEPKK